MGIFLGRAREVRSAMPWGGEPPVPAYPGAWGFNSTDGSSPDGALQVPTVWACVKKLADAVSMLPLETYQVTAGVPRRVPSPALIASPALGMTQSEWLHQLMVSLLLRGNAFGMIVSRDRQMRPTQIEPLSPDAVRVDVDSSGNVTYQLRRTMKDITADVWHMRGMTMPGAKVGLSPIAYAAAGLGIDLAASQFARDFFEGGGVPKALVYSDQILDQDKAQTIKDKILAATRRREPLVLPLGLKYEKISVSPEESQFLATQQANIAKIAGYFGVPPEMVGGSRGSAVTYSSTEMQGLEFLTYSVAWWLRRFEEAISALLPPGLSVKFNEEALLRTDAETQAKVDNMRIAGKVIVGSEARAKLGLPPFTPEQQAEAEMVPLTVTPSGVPKALTPSAQGPEASVPANDDVQQNSATVLPLLRNEV
ncbi:MAG: phage portal protein [Blastococcus sp.]